MASLKTLLGVVLAFSLVAMPATVWAQPWQSTDPAEAGWKTEEVAAIKQRAMALNPMAVMIVQNDKVVAQWGDVTRKIEVASVRKSLINALYGIAVFDGTIKLSSSLADLDIDDTPPRLTREEKTATVRDLLMARSGVYHPAAHETGVMKRNRPERGSHQPGSFWFYNNWDFNTLGTIYRQETGEDIFESFETKIAEPIGMEDFSARDGRYVFERASEHPAFLFRLTARDAARFGQLYLNQGRWNGKQIVPADWIAESTTGYSQTARGHQKYGYMWWSLPAKTWGPRAAYAVGDGGQIIAYVPDKQLVVVQFVDRKTNPLRIRTSRFINLLKEIAAAAP